MNFYKVMLLGEIGVGKTSLVHRLIDGEFRTDYGPTMGVDHFNYTPSAEVSGGGDDVGLVIWDTDGDFGQAIFQHAYIVGAAGGLIVDDASRPSTLKSMLTLATGCEDTVPGRPYSFVINKLDLVDDQHPLVIPDALANSKRLFQTSAKTGINVTKAFDDTAATIIRREL